MASELMDVQLTALVLHKGRQSQGPLGATGLSGPLPKLSHSLQFQHRETQILVLMESVTTVFLGRLAVAWGLHPSGKT